MSTKFYFNLLRSTQFHHSEPQVKWWSCILTALAKGEPANKTGPAEPMDISEDQSLPVTQKEIIETNGNHKAPTVDIPSAEAPAVAETKELTARTQAINSEAEIKTDLENSIDKAM